MPQTAYFASGCFWSKEYAFSRLPGVRATRVGFMGGHTAHPTYRQVCSKATGHAETVEVVFEPDQISFAALARFFFEIHDPSLDRPGQYRSAVFYTNSEQQAIVKALLGELRARGHHPFTELTAARTFWEAEARHQGYCAQRGFQPRIKRKNRFAARAGGADH